MVARAQWVEALGGGGGTVECWAVGDAVGGGAELEGEAVGKKFGEGVLAD